MTARARRSTTLAALGLASALAPDALAEPETSSLRTGIHLALRTGFGVPFGRYAETRTLATFRDDEVNAIGDDTYGVIPLWLDAGYWLSSHVMLGGYVAYGLVLPRVAAAADPLGGGCPEGVDCFAIGLRSGVQAQFALPQLGPLHPWLGLGFGYEWVSTELDGELLGFPLETSTWHYGPELLQLQAGADVQLRSNFALGGFAALSVVQYAGCSATLSGQDQPCALYDGAWHGWVVLGVRGSLAL